MKRLTMILAAAAAAFALASCTKEETAIQENTGLRLNITVSNPDGSADTRAVKKGWEAGDKLNIWFDTNTDYSTSGKPDAIIVYDGTSWKEDGGATLSGNAPSASGTLKVIYEATNNWYENYTHDSAASKSPYESSTHSYASSMMVYSNGSAYTVSDNELSATISDWTYATPVQIVITGLDSERAGDYYLTLDANIGYSSGIKMDASGISTLAGTVNPWEMKPKQIGIPNSDGVAFYMQPVSATGSQSQFRFSLFDKTNKVNRSITLPSSIAADVKKCQSFKTDVKKCEPTGFVIDGLSYTVSGGEATLMKGTYFAGGALYKGDISVPSSVVFDGKTYPVIEIGQNAFKDCKELTSVTLPEGITTIEAYAFDYTSLKSLMLPASLKDINSSNSVFRGNKELIISVAEGNKTFSVDNDILYGKYTDGLFTVFYVPEFMTGDIVLNERTEAVCSNGTLYNTAADSIEFPACLKSLWGQFRGTIKDGLVIKLNFTTYEAVTAVFGDPLKIYTIGDNNRKKIVYSFPAEMSDEEFQKVKTYLESNVKSVVKRNS